jgi:hypothetical protein
MCRSEKIGKLVEESPSTAIESLCRWKEKEDQIWKEEREEEWIHKVGEGNPREEEEGREKRLECKRIKREVKGEERRLGHLQNLNRGKGLEALRRRVVPFRHLPFQKQKTKKIWNM